jgi:hypothetical protein
MIIPTIIQEQLDSTAKMSLSYGVGGATTALAVVGACTLSRL